MCQGGVVVVVEAAVHRCHWPSERIRRRIDVVSLRLVSKPQEQVLLQSIL